MGGPITIRVNGDDVFVNGHDIREDRTARLFFLGSLGASEVVDGWRCPRRHMPAAAVVVRINTFLESKGWRVLRAGLANEAVERALEQKRSFTRTRDAAEALLGGE